MSKLFVCFVLLSASSSVLTSAQYLASDKLPFTVTTYNDSAYIQRGKSYQRIIYDASDELGGTKTNMIMNYIYLEPCGIFQPHMHPGLSELDYILQGTIRGAAVLSPPSGNMVGDIILSSSAPPSADRVFAVAEGTFHYAENIDCNNPAVLIQTLSGGEEMNFIDVFTTMFNMAPSALQYGLNLTKAQIQSSAGYVQPIFSVNQNCLATCGAPAPGPSAAKTG